MNWAWTWTGQCVGYWDGDDLWTLQGRHVGRRHGSDIYGPNGRYLGEVMGNNRLATNKAKAALTGPTFIPLAPRDKQLSQPNQDTYPLYMGFEDFRNPELFEPYNER